MTGHLSGWCSSLGRHQGFHQTCTDRLRLGLLDRCDCPEHANDQPATEDAA